MVDAKTVREVATKYLYDRCVAVAAIGQLLFSFLFRAYSLTRQLYCSVIHCIW